MAMVQCKECGGEISENANTCPHCGDVIKEPRPKFSLVDLIQKISVPVVGIDFSPKAIEAARSLAKELQIEVEFLECDVYDAADRLQRTFDVVFSSYGVLCWLGDLQRWADNVARLVAPSGLFYLVEFHPFVWALADDATADRPAMGYPYLPHQVPNYFASGTDYIDSSATTPPHYTWNHGLGSDHLPARTRPGARVPARDALLRERHYTNVEG
jgi:SAM-dependent methyltransferase